MIRTRLHFAHVAVLTAATLAGAGCQEAGLEQARSCPDGPCDSLYDDRLAGDVLFAKVEDVLSNDLDASFRYALDRAVADAAELDVEPWPDVMCSGGPAQLFWNGEDRALSRLGMIGIANVVALESRSRNGNPRGHVRLLGSAYGDDADATAALEIIASLQSPALFMEAVGALVESPFVSDGAHRALLRSELDFLESKRLRGADGKLRVPDLNDPPSSNELLGTLLESPVPQHRAAGAHVLVRESATASTNQVDALFADPHVLVKVAAAPLIWKSSSPQSTIAQTLAWLNGPQGRAQIRLLLLGVATEEEAEGWADEPAGFVGLLSETIAEFVGEALRSAPADADIAPLVDAAGHLGQVTAVTADAAEAVARSTALSSAEKKSALLALLPAASAMQWDHPHALSVLCRQLAGRLLAGTDADIVAALGEHIDLPADVDVQAVESQLSSGKFSDRVAGLKAIAAFQPGLVAALFDAGEGTVELARSSDGFALSAGLDNGLPPAEVIEHILGFAQPAEEGGETIEFWNPSELSYVAAYLEAIDSDQLSPAEKVDAIVRFAAVTSPFNTVAPVAPGPGALYLGNEVATIFSRINELSISAEDRVAAWTDVLIRPDGSLRRHLLEATPRDESTRGIIASLVLPHLVQTATTCWEGRRNPDNERPGIAIGLVPYVVSPPSLGVDPDDVMDRRIESLRDRSASGPELPPTPTVDDVLAARPAAQDLYFGGQWTAEDRALFETPAQEIAEWIVSSTEDEKWYVGEHVFALGAAEDYDQLPASTWNAVDDFLQQKIAQGWDREGVSALRFYLHATRGMSYDELASRFDEDVRLRWDLASEARSGGEKAALETLLAATGTRFGTSYGLLQLAARVAFRADVSDEFRLGLVQLAADGWGSWSTGSLTLARMRATSLDDALLLGASFRASESSAGMPMPTELVGTAVADERLGAAAATRLAWITLANGRFVEDAFGQAPATATSAIDMVVGIASRADVEPAEKRALGRALLDVLP